jgi:hypothetical protein
MLARRWRRGDAELAAVPYGPPPALAGEPAGQAEP